MSVYRYRNIVSFCYSKETKSHKEALEIISTVGCSISLVAVAITIAVHVLFWRILRSPRTKVLLNLCAAVAISCILVISEKSARSKVSKRVTTIYEHTHVRANPEKQLEKKYTFK